MKGQLVEPWSTASVHAARERLQGLIRTTPLVPSTWLSRAVGRPVYLKLESLQETGSFKARGAMHRLLCLGAEERRRGVVTASAGNHGQAVSWAASRLGLRAVVVLPREAVPIKVERTRSWGAEVVQIGETYEDAHKHAEELATHEGLTYIPAFDHPDVAAGQGTLALEILEQCPEVGVVISPIGGGGLISGIILATAPQRHQTVVVGVQSTHTPGMADALHAGHPVPIAYLPTLADGLAGEVCMTTMEICRRSQTEVMLVPEEMLLGTIGALLRYEHLAMEGSAAVAVAAVLRGQFPRGESPLVILISGGNVAPEVLAAAATAAEPLL